MIFDTFKLLVSSSILHKQNYTYKFNVGTLEVILITVYFFNLQKEHLFSKSIILEQYSSWNI